MGSGAILTDEPSPLRESYQIVIGQVMQLAAENRKVQRRRDRTAPYSPQNDMDVHRLSAQLTIINRDKIHSIGELEGKIESLKASYERARQELNLLSTQHDKLFSLIQQAETYFELSGKAELSDMEQLKLTVCRQSVENNGIRTPADLDRMKAAFAETDKKTAALKENFKRCQQLFDVYSDIAKTYYDISSSDYISRLVEEERKRQEQELRRKR